MLVNTVAGVLGTALLLRAYMLWNGISAFNPLGQFAYALTDWLVMPLRRLVPLPGRIDWPSLLAAYLVALAALMPIVAGIGGNSGNQTITLIVRSIALGQVQREHAKKLLAKELGVSLLNGLIWGSALGLIAYWLYQKVSLGLVMTAAMTLNLALSATAGVLIPLTMMRLGRDPALGSSVMITAITDSGGFFIFLGLATLFLV